jgi:PAS domain S-box-containing protein
MALHEFAPPPIAHQSVATILELLCDRFDDVLTGIGRRLANHPVPNLAITPDHLDHAREVHTALKRARSGDWGPLDQQARAFAQHWVEGRELGRDALTGLLKHVIRPSVYPLLDPQRSLPDQLGGLDLLVSRLSTWVSLELDRRHRDVERDALFLRSVIEHIPHMIFVKSADDLRFVRFNRAGEELLGYSRDELLGKSDRDFFPPDEAEFFNAQDREVLEGGVLADVQEEPIQTRHQGTRYLHTKKLPILGPDGKPRYLLGISEDITERKRVQQELERARDDAELANRSKGEFLARMSHEIRTPLNGIIGLSELALEAQDTPTEHAEGLRMILSSAETLLHLVNEVLDFSKLEADKVEMEEIAFDLEALVEETAAGFVLRARERGLTLETDCDPDLPPWVLGDPHRLRQVLSNLLDNALRFTHEGSVRVEARGDGNLLRFAVADTGIGIPADKLEVIFSPFDQADGSVTREYGGTGLGLPICQRLLEKMGGQMWVESSDAGSVFRFTIPERQPVSSPLQQAPEDLQVPLPELPPLKVLLAEDNAVNRTLVVRLLERLGHRVVAAATGQEVLALLEDEGGFDLVLMDVEMPELSGLEATRQIRAQEAGQRHLPILALTARALKGDREVCLEAGMDGYVEKPVRKPRLLASIAQVLGKSPREPEAPTPLGHSDSGP